MAESDWLRDVAEQLAIPALDDDVTTALLDLARDVAHNTERRYAPLTCFLVGAAMGNDRAAVIDLAKRLAEQARAVSSTGGAG